MVSTMLWVFVLALLFLVWAMLTIGSKIDDIMLGDDQYKTKEELDREIKGR